MWRDNDSTSLPVCPRVLVVGAGIIGMSTAWTLLDAGYNVTVVAKDFAGRGVTSHRLTSQIAGALWEYPPAVCGHHALDQLALDRPQRWSMVSYHVFRQMAADPPVSRDYGVRMRMASFFFKEPVRSDEFQLQKMRNIASSGVHGFRHSASLIREAGIVAGEYKDAYELNSPVIDTDQALISITELVERKGAVFEKNIELEGSLLDLEGSLLQKYNAENIYPLRGAVLRLLNDGKEFRTLDRCYVVSASGADDDETSEFIFIIPRNNNIVYVGGCSQPNVVEPMQANDPLVTNISNRARHFMPSLKTYHRDPAMPVAYGGVRLEREKGTRIIHCYGHGGSGWSLSFGCALDVKSLVDDTIADIGK
ncbi:hypothetical protein BKA62DRAFT_751562 [Auriculariales sp. MPI-PUGE-AT-0066]|nr:hypothetical protein BKA62DRAFT_751562 [Auriculariales sp. MPI-PUGE-AT-0066]